MCTSCREEHPKVVSFNQKEEHELSGSRGSANFVWRCSNCKVGSGDTGGGHGVGAVDRENSEDREGHKGQLY